MVYNALKLFMEINPELFDDCLQSYKQNRLDERQHLQQRYEGWQKLREAAIQNCTSPDTLPASVLDTSYPPPPPQDDPDVTDIAIDLSAAVIEAEAADVNLDESGGIERVPAADPGIIDDIRGRSFQEIPADNANGQSPHIRRKSVIPVDPTVLRDLQAHRTADLNGPPRSMAYGP